MRIRRVLSIAARDLRMEMKGFQGLLLPGVMAGLLVPVSTIKLPELGASRRVDAAVVVRGDLPAWVDELPNVERGERGRKLMTNAEGVVLYAGSPSSAFREAFDGENPPVEVVTASRDMTIPKRTLLFALLSASTLVGAVSSSVGGERSAGTLVALLTAAVTRTEIVVGKWLAWSAFGVGAALVATALAGAMGTVELGTWLLPMVLVPASAVALGLWLVRSATDVMGGTAVSMRVIPAVLSTSALLGWIAMHTHVPGAEWIAALMPFGGVLLAAGQVSEAAWFPFVASASTALTIVVLLAMTIRDLDERPMASQPVGPATVAIAVTLLAGLAWLIPLGGPLLWAQAGNSRLTGELPLEDAVFAGVVATLAITLVRVGQSSNPGQELALGLGRPASIRWAVVAMAILAFSAGVVGLMPGFEDGLLAQLRLRQSLALQPTSFGLCLGVVLADELLFRGWLQTRIGPMRAAVVYALVRAPLDPLRGLIMGGTLSLGRELSGSVWVGVLARMAWWSLALNVPGFSPLTALFVAAAGMGFMAYQLQTRSEPASP